MHDIWVYSVTTYHLIPLFSLSNQWRFYKVQSNFKKQCTEGYSIHKSQLLSTELFDAPENLLHTLYSILNADWSCLSTSNLVCSKIYEG